LADVAGVLRRRVAGLDGPATFYAWYDGQAGQLRCSLASAGPDDLPFGGRYFPTTDAMSAIGQLLADTSPDVIPWTDLNQAAGEVPKPPPDPFPAWVAHLA
jgi:hypothetical protein